MIVYRSKRRPSLLVRLLPAVLLAAIILVVLFIFRAAPVVSDPVPYVAKSPKTNSLSSAALPARLTIPSIKLDAVVAYAGLRSDGTMDISDNPDQVAWYEFGTRPGNEGSAVIAGHYGWTGLHGSVFNDLHLLKKGDKVSVIDKYDKLVTFVVTKTEKYDPSADATAIFRSSDGKAHLNLITCDGDWVPDKNSYSDRLVVFTDLE